MSAPENDTPPPEPTAGAHTDATDGQDHEAAAATGAPPGDDGLGLTPTERAFQLSSNVRVLQDGHRTIYLVGTAHVSRASVDEVVEVIRELQPDTVCVELCQARYDALTDEDRWKNLDIFKVIREGKTLFLLANLAIGAWQRRIGQELGVQPGAELLAAAKEAEGIGAKVRLIDRDIHVTLRRTWGNLRLRDKFVLMSAIGGSLFGGGDQLDGESIEALKDQGNLEDMLHEFAQAFPAVKGPLIDERDQFMASHLQEAGGEVIVAVVGAAHGPGIEREFAHPVDRRPLNAMPPKSRVGDVIKWAIPLAILVGFYLGITSEEPRSMRELLFAWVLPNSIAAAVLTIAAGGKLASILAAFVASPLTSLNPLVNTGLVVGLVDAWARKPTVEDAQSINRDVQSFSGFYRNRFTRVLLVATFAMIGSALGAWIGLAWVYGLVAG